MCCKYHNVKGGWRGIRFAIVPPHPSTNHYQKSVFKIEMHIYDCRRVFLMFCFKFVTIGCCFVLSDGAYWPPPPPQLCLSKEKQKKANRLIPLPRADTLLFFNFTYGVVDIFLILIIIIIVLRKTATATPKVPLPTWPNIGRGVCVCRFSYLRPRSFFFPALHHPLWILWFLCVRNPKCDDF